MGKQTRRNQKYEILEDLSMQDFLYSGTFRKISGVLSKILAQINRTFSRGVQKPGGNASRCRSWYVHRPFLNFVRMQCYEPGLHLTAVEHHSLLEGGFSGCEGISVYRYIISQPCQYKPRAIARTSSVASSVASMCASTRERSWSWKKAQNQVRVCMWNW